MKHEKDYPPYISFATALAMGGERLIRAAGKISGLATYAPNIDDAIELYILSDVHAALAKLNQRIAEYKDAIKEGTQ